MGANLARDRGKSHELEAIADHQNSINVLAVSEDQSVLVTGSEDGTARLYSSHTENTECMGVLRGHTGYITAISSVGEYVVTGSADASVRKWRMHDCACMFVYRGHQARVTRLLCSPDFIVSASYDRTCKLWRFDMSSTMSVGSDAGNNDGDDGDEDCIDNDDLQSIACVRTFSGHTAGVYPLCFIPGDMDFAADNADSAGIGGEHSDNENASNTDKQDPAIVKPLSGHQMTVVDGLHPLDVLISGSADGTARSWSAAGGQQLHVFRGHRGAVTCVAVNGTGRLLYTASTDGTVREWLVGSGACTKRLATQHTDAIVSMQLVNHLLYTGSADTTARCFVTEFGDCARAYTGQRDTVICVRFSDGVVYTGSGDTMARAYDARSGRLLRVYAGHQGAVNCVAVIGRRLYTGSSDGVLRVWDADIQVQQTLPPLDTVVAAKHSTIPEESRQTTNTDTDNNDLAETTSINMSESMA